ncbi:MAG: TRAP transporter small permease [bacterium]
MTTLSEKINNILKPLNVLIRIVLTVFFAAMVLVVSAQVFYRYVLSAPIPWAEESARFMFAWVVFLGASVAVKDKAHTGVELFVSLMPEKMQHIVAMLTYFICMVFVALVGNYGLQLATSTSSQHSPAMHLSMFFPYLSVPLGCLFMLINFVYLIVVEIEALQKDVNQGASGA